MVVATGESVFHSRIKVCLHAGTRLAEQGMRHPAAKRRFTMAQAPQAGQNQDHGKPQEPDKTDNLEENAGTPPGEDQGDPGTQPEEEIPNNTGAQSEDVGNEPGKPQPD